ncbi:hypothetical protein F2Q70_00045682 [Brassica cretica]|uniref:Uncharacterized protein n=1 Tax=Brassica cretica TaxID=69181 RepID=A0A8S9KJT2_BRACR|nr:hypothetical protein F2Q70_00045682 [Brassica cretica]
MVQLSLRRAGLGRASSSCGELNRLVRLVVRRTGSVEPARSVADAVFALERHCSKCFRLDHMSMTVWLQNMRQKLGKLQMGKGASRWRMIRDVMEDTNLHGRVISFDSLHTTPVSPTDREIPDTSLMIHTMMQGPRLNPNGDQSPSMRHTSVALRNLLEISREATIVEPPVRGMIHHTTGEIAHNNSPSSPRGRERHRREETNSSKGLRNTDERGNPLLLDQQSVPHEAFNEALEEVREVMVQYTQCADPTESAARKERLRKAEKEGQLEETAARMVQASLADKPEEQQQDRNNRETQTRKATRSSNNTVKSKADKRLKLEEKKATATKDHAVPT